MGCVQCGVGGWDGYEISYVSWRLGVYMGFMCNLKMAVVKKPKHVVVPWVVM